MSDKGKIAKNIPNEVWVAALDVINKLIYPVTAITVGVGKLIEQKFSTLNEVQKIIAEQTLKEAVEKVKTQTPPLENVIVKPNIIYFALENIDSMVDEKIRSLWTNLLAREFIEGSIHPEIVRLISKLTAPDLVILSSLYEQDSSKALIAFKALKSVYSLGLLSDPRSFNHVYLQDLGLIQDISGKWFCTTKGREVIRSTKNLETNC